jgi:Flp pilus assembly protein TadG
MIALPTPQPAEKGQSLVEFGLGLVLLLILVSGVIDLGRAFFTIVTLNDAAKEGTTYGSICPDDEAGIKTRLIESATDPIALSNLTSADIQVCVSTAGSDACGAPLAIGNEISVLVTYDHELSTPFMGTILGTQTVQLTARAREKILRSPCQ